MRSTHSQNCGWISIPENLYKDPQQKYLTVFVYHSCGSFAPRVFMYDKLSTFIRLFNSLNYQIDGSLRMSPDWENEPKLSYYLTWYDSCFVLCFFFSISLYNTEMFGGLVCVKWRRKTHTFHRQSHFLVFKWKNTHTHTHFVKESFIFRHKTNVACDRSNCIPHESSRKHPSNCFKAHWRKWVEGRWIHLLFKSFSFKLLRPYIYSALFTFEMQPSTHRKHAHRAYATNNTK